MIRLFFFATFLCYVLTACKPYKLDKGDLEIINTYQKGDTLVFVSQSGRVDSIEITDKSFITTVIVKGMKAIQKDAGFIIRQSHRENQS
jgi:hypothetical protein